MEEHEILTNPRGLFKFLLEITPGHEARLVSCNYQFEVAVFGFKNRYPMEYREICMNRPVDESSLDMDQNQGNEQEEEMDESDTLPQINAVVQANQDVSQLSGVRSERPLLNGNIGVKERKPRNRVNEAAAKRAKSRSVTTAAKRGIIDRSVSPAVFENSPLLEDDDDNTL